MIFVSFFLFSLSGEKIKIKSGVKASIPKDKKAAAFKYLEANGAASLIKHELKATFGKGEDKAAEALAAHLTKSGARFDDKRNVPWNTLTAWVNERIENGKPVDQGLLGVYEYQEAKINRK